MKLYCCDKCGSLDVFIDDRGNQKALNNKLKSNYF